MIISYRWDVISKGELFFACIGYYISNDCAQKVPIVLQVSLAEKNDPSMKKNNTKWHCRGHEPWISIDIQLNEFPNPSWQALHWPWLVAAGSKTITQIDMPSKSWKFSFCLQSLSLRPETAGKVVKLYLSYKKVTNTKNSVEETSKTSAFCYKLDSEKSEHLSLHSEIGYYKSAMVDPP